MKYSIIFLCILFLAGCRSYNIPEASKSHPANPDAKSCTEAEKIQPLKIDKNDLPKPPIEMTQKKMKHM